MKLLTLNSSKDDIFCAFCALQNISYEAVNHERHWISIFTNFEVLLPKDSEEQKLIGKFLASLDSLITLHQRKPKKHNL